MATQTLVLNLVGRDNLSQALTRAGSATEALSSKLNRFGRGVSSVGRTLTYGLTLPIVGAGAASVKLAADFDKTMRQVSIATDGPTKALKALALQLGRDTAFSAADASQAMLELAKGGMTAAQIRAGALASTMKLAAAGSVDLASSATFVSNAMHAFSLDATDANSVAVALAGAANASSASVQSLGLGLSQVSAVAHATGLSLQETVGVLAAFDNAGLKGSDAGTSLKTMLLRLVPSTQAAKDEMSKLNLSFVDAKGNIDGIETVAQKLQDRLGGLTQAQRVQALQTIFGTDAFRAANILFEQGAAGLGKDIKATRDFTTTNRLANASMRGLSGAIERAKGSLETAAIVIGERLAPYVVAVARKIEDWANAFAKLSPNVQKTILVVAGLAAAAGPLLVVVGTLATGLAALTGTVGLVVAGLAVFTAAFVTAYTQSEEFRDTVNAAMAQVSATVSSFVALAEALWARFGDTITKYGIGAVKAFAVQLKGWLSVIQGIVDVFTGILTGDWSKAWDGVKEIASGALLIVKGAVQGFVNAVKGILSALWDIVGDAFSKAWDKAVSATVAGVAKVVHWLQTVPIKVARALAGLPGQLFQAGIDAIQGLIDGIKSKIGELTDTVSGIGDGIVGTFKHVLDIGSPSKVMHGLGQDTVQGLIDGLRSKLSEVRAAMGEISQTISTTLVTSPFDAPASTAQGLIAAQGQSLADANRFTRDLRKLVDMGLSKALVRQLIQSGNFAAIHDLADSTQRQVDRLNREYAQTVTAAGRSERIVDRYLGLTDRAKSLRDRIEIGTEIQRQVVVHQHGVHLGPTLRQIKKAAREGAEHGLIIAGAP